MKDRLLLLAFFFSGAAALGYELLWTRLLSLALGSESLGVLATLAGFFCGLALGSWWLHERARRGAHPARFFAVLEVVAATFALASPHLLGDLALRLPRWLGPTAGDNDSLIALVLSLLAATVLLLPGTVPMGATLAALVEARRRACRDDAEGVGLGRLYAANTAGATAGTLLTVFVLLPRLGLALGSVALAGLGLGSALLALAWSRRHADEPGVEKAPSSPKEAGLAFTARWVHPILVLTGLAGVGLEVVGIQVMTQKLENTVYTFANVLAVYLVGTALGAFLYSRRAAEVRPARRAENADPWTAKLLAAHVVAVAVAAIALRTSPDLLGRLLPPGASYGRHLAAELALAIAVFLVPTIFMGALFSHLMAFVAPRGVGRAYALNTLGATLAPFVFGLGAIRNLGYAPALFLVAFLYLALFAFVAWRAPVPRRLAWTGLAAGLGACLLAPKSFFLVPIPPGFKAVAHEEGLMGLVLVTEESGSALANGQPYRRLQINQHFRMGGSASFGEQRLGHLPLLFAPEARRALFLGVGTGATLSAVRHFSLEQVDAIELVPGVLRFLPQFAHVNEQILDDARVRFHAADARRFVAAAAERFDVVVGDLFHPGLDGAGALYSREHFAMVRERLREGGVFAQWIPLYQFDVENLRTVVRTFLAVFPEVHSFLGIYNAQTPALVLLGRVETGRPWIALDELEGRLDAPVYERLLMADPRDLMASYMADRPALERFAGAGPLNTDLAPRILFDAPRSAYENLPDLAYSSLVLLMEERGVFPAGFLGGPPERLDAFRREVEGFSAALTFYLRGEVLRIRAGGDIDPAVLENYLSAYAKAPELRPAAGLLHALAGDDPRLAATLLPLMLQVAPDDEETYRQYLGLLELTGDRERFAEILAEARRRFGEAAFPV